MKNCENCREKKNLGEACEKCNLFNKIIQRYYDANIPVKYWDIGMNPESFEGGKDLLKIYKDLTDNISKTYSSGASVCLTGLHGNGKTTVVSNILKLALEKGYSAHYVTINDIISTFTANTRDADKLLIRNYLLTVDFLVIDEFDSRFFSTENAADLFGKTFEDIFRTRSQNKVPTLICSNSKSVSAKEFAEENFHGSIKQSIESIMNYMKIYPVLGKDLRKQGL